MVMRLYQQIGDVDSFAGLPATAQNKQLAMDDSYNTYLYSTSVPGWIPLARTAIKKSTVVLDGKTTGAVPIYTLEQASMNFYPTQIIIRAVNISGGVLKPTLTVGTNSTAYDNIATGSLLNTVTSLVGITSQPQNVSTSPALTPGSVIYANISTGAIATSYTFKIDVIGYYET